MAAEGVKVEPEFEAGVLPIGEFVAAENEYIALKEANMRDPATAGRVKALLDRTTRLWEWFQRGGFYSSNELLEEMSTATVRFFVLPYYIGQLHLKIVDREERPSRIQAAEGSLQVFDNLMMGFSVIEKPRVAKDPFERREIDREDFMARRQLEQSLVELNKRPDPDEELEREIIFSNLKLCALEGRRGIKQCQQEYELAVKFARGDRPERPTEPPRPMWVKRIDSKEEARAKVFKPWQELLPRPLPPEDETMAKPGKPGPREDASDDEEAEKARKDKADWDDWKQDHPPFSWMGEEKVENKGRATMPD